MESDYKTTLSEYRNIINDVFGLPDCLTERMIKYVDAGVDSQLLGLLDDLISCGESYYLKGNIRMAQANLFLLRFLVKGHLKGGKD